MKNLSEKVSHIWIKQQLDHWKEYIPAVAAEDIIQRIVNGETIEEIIDEITKSGAIPGLPQPMAIVRDPRYTMSDDDEENDAKRKRYRIKKQNKRDKIGERIEDAKIRGKESRRGGSGF